VLATILGRRTSHPVGWVRDGQVVAPGHVVVCPPGVHLELSPDGRCHLRETESLGERRFDVLLASVAGSYGPRSVAVILSGSGQDGAVGTVAMKRAGAVVIAQSPDTARYSSMPLAAARAGADRVVPIDEIGGLLAAIVAGAPLPEPSEKDCVARVVAHASGEPAAPRSDAQSPSQSMNSAAARAEKARLRAAELQARRRDLSAGFGATAQTVATAQLRAAESSQRAQLADQAAQEAAVRFAH
jgi:two-component system chemotaxis response regulator CheB